MIKSENGALLNFVTLDVRGRDIVGFVDEAQRIVAQKVKLPEGVHIAWSGEFRAPCACRAYPADGVSRRDRLDLHHPLSYL